MLKPPVRVLARLSRDRPQVLRRAGAGFILLAGLLVLTEAFGRSFSHIGIAGASLFITEVALLGAFALSLRRHGVGAGVRVVADRIPAGLLLVFWLTGLVAIIRGLEDYGVGMTLDDIGLAEYSVLLPIIALVADSQQRTEALNRLLAYGGIATVVVFGVSDLTDRATNGAVSLLPFIGEAAGLYMTFYVVWVASHLVRGASLARAHLVVAPIAVVMIGLTDKRSSWIALGVGLLAVAALAPSWRRRAAGIAASILLLALSILGAVGVEAIFGPSSGAVSANQWDPTNHHGRGSPTQVSQQLGGLAGGLSGGGSGGGSGGASGRGARQSAETQSVRWRFAFWHVLLQRSTHSPLFGVGFGKPSDFRWEGKWYDFRQSVHPDVSGPHNGFVDILYRMGGFALAALLGLIGVAAWRLRRLRRGHGCSDRDHVRQVALVGMFLAATAVVLLNDALRVPYLAIYFWALLGLLLVESRVERDAVDDGTGEVGVD